LEIFRNREKIGRSLRKVGTQEMFKRKRGHIIGLEKAILPLFYQDRGSFIEVMRYCIALNGSLFNTQRMMQEYLLKAYFR